MNTKEKKRIDFYFVSSYICLETWNIRLPNLGRQKEKYTKKNVCSFLIELRCPIFDLLL